LANFWQTLRGPLSAVSKQASKQAKSKQASTQKASGAAKLDDGRKQQALKSTSGVQT